MFTANEILLSLISEQITNTFIVRLTTKTVKKREYLNEKFSFYELYTCKNRIILHLCIFNDIINEWTYVKIAYCMFGKDVGLMAKKQQLIPLSSLNKLDSQTVGHDILRYISLPNLLGNEAETILYYMGRNLARSFEITSVDDVHFLFEKLGWGYLDLVKQRKNSFTFSLMADALARRLNLDLAKEFRLEAGFLAESMYILYSKKCECIEKINKNIHQVQFKVIFTD